jgi:hypothetical protein
MSHQTELIITTDTHCFCNLAPYQFIIKSLDIIPGALLCQGFIEGPPGATGPTGPQGYQGAQGPAVSGAQGIGGIGGDLGAQGKLGAQGARGAQGRIGRIGDIGAIGLKGPDSTVQGAQGIQGMMGIMGGEGPIGAQGVQGAQGSQGVSAYVLNSNVFVGQSDISGTTTDGFLMNWFRGTDTAVASNVYLVYQKIVSGSNSIVTVKISEFVSVGSTDPMTGVPVVACLSSESLPSAIRTSGSIPNIFPCIIQVNGTQRQSAIKIGPSVLTVYSSLTEIATNCTGGGFVIDDVVLFPTQVFTYLIS